MMQKLEPNTARQKSMKIGDVDRVNDCILIPTAFLRLCLFQHLLESFGAVHPSISKCFVSCLHRALVLMNLHLSISNRLLVNFIFILATGPLLLLCGGRELKHIFK